MFSKVTGQIVYPILNGNGVAGEVTKLTSYFIPHLIKDVIIYPYLGLKLIHIINRDSWWLVLFGFLSNHKNKWLLHTLSYLYTLILNSLSKDRNK